VTFEDSLNEGLRGVVLLVSPLVELVAASACSLSAGSSSCCLLFLHVSVHIVIRFAFFSDRGQGSLTDNLFVFANHGSSVFLNFRPVSLNTILVFREVSAVKGLEVGKPELELGAEYVVSSGVAGEHGVQGIFDEVQMLDFRVLHRPKHKRYTPAEVIDSCYLRCEKS